MNQRNKNNSIVFLTTLSVYLGLVLVGGASPQVWAQRSNDKSGEPNKISIVVPGEGLIFTFDLNPLIELNRLSVAESLPVKMSGKIIFSSGKKVENWEAINAVAGNQKIIDLLNKEFFAPTLSSLLPNDLSRLFPIPKELFQSIEVDEDHITVARTMKFGDAKLAARMAEIYSRMADYAKSAKADKQIAGNLYLTNTEARSENNQVFVVTRLPRGSLDQLLKQDAKAESK